MAPRSALAALLLAFAATVTVAVPPGPDASVSGFIKGACRCRDSAAKQPSPLARLPSPRQRGDTRRGYTHHIGWCRAVWRASQLLCGDCESTSPCLTLTWVPPPCQCPTPTTRPSSTGCSTAGPAPRPTRWSCALPRSRLGARFPLTTRHAPTCRWLTGGPGCSSELALFMENGPMSINPNPQSAADVTRNPWSWNARANLVCCCPPRLSVGFVL